MFNRISQLAWSKYESKYVIINLKQMWEQTESNNYTRVKVNKIKIKLKHEIE